MMQAAAKINLVLIDFSSNAGFVDSRCAVNADGSYVDFLLSELARSSRSRQSFHELANRLTKLAEHAYYFRDMKTVQEVSLVLMSLPLDSARQMGHYYQALALKRSGEKAKAQALLESIAESAPLEYRVRAIQTLGTIYHERGELDDALALYLESARAAKHNEAPASFASLIAHSQVSFIKSDVGDHRGALTHLQSLSTLAACAARQSPFYFYAYQNALAVEFGALGRLAEAEAACAIALASPFAPAYPEWSETRDEIAAKRKAASPSFVAIHQVPEAYRTHEAHHAAQVDRATEANRATQAQSQRQPEPSRVLIFGRPAYNKDFFQRSAIKFPARAITALSTVSILDRVRICIGSRAPPSRS